MLWSSPLVSSGHTNPIGQRTTKMAEVQMYGVELESRCLANVAESEETVRFIVGTQNMKLTNQICEVKLDGNRIVARSLPHSIGEVRGLASDPHDASRIVTASSDYGKTAPSHSLNLYRMMDDEDILEEVKTTSVDGEINNVEWEPECNRIATLNVGRIEVCDMERPFETTWKRIQNGEVAVVRWSSHNGGNVLGTPVDRDILTFDIRTNEEGQRISSAHSLRCLYLDFNPNMQHMVVSSGRDGLLRVWDWRKTDSPLLSLRAHAHWATQVHYHPVHDQLLLSCGVDASLVLTSVQSVSSDSLPDPDDEGEEERTVLPDGQLERIDEHEDSVYASAWSTADPWTFASLSYDGRILLSHVNREHKYALMRL